MAEDDRDRTREADGDVPADGGEALVGVYAEDDSDVDGDRSIVLRKRDGDDGH